MDVSQLQSVAATVGGVVKSATLRDAQLDPKLVAAAHQFEASMMAELLKPLTSGQTFGGDDEEAGGGAAGGGGLSDLTSSADGSGGALMSLGSEALAKALSEKGGLGIARRVLDHFEAAGETAKRASADPNHAEKLATGKIRYGIGNHY